MKKRDSLDHNGAVTDLCYRIYNKKTDGSCGKKLKFTINLYHTTSQFLVNGSKVDLFLSDIYERLCSEMKACCNVLDIMNINIATAIKNGTSKAQLSDNEHGKKLNQVKAISGRDSLTDQNIMDASEDELEVCEICPLCQKQAYGKTVQCGECGEWFHLECLQTDDSSMQALGEDDFVCQMCSENLLYAESGKDNPPSISVKQVELDLMKARTDTEASGENTHRKSVINAQAIQTDNIDSHSPARNPGTNAAPSSNSDETCEMLSKSSCKVKKSSKVNKVKKDDIQDKTYILELENQIGVLKSTVDLYKKIHDQRANQNGKNDYKEPIESEAEPVLCKADHGCRHKCCSDLADKIQENRLRLIETQMLQNMYINNAMHIQLATQIRTSYSPQIPPYTDPWLLNRHNVPPHGFPYTLYPNQHPVRGLHTYHPPIPPFMTTSHTSMVNTPCMPTGNIRQPIYFPQYHQPVYRYPSAPVPPIHPQMGQVYQHQNELQDLTTPQLPQQVPGVSHPHNGPQLPPTIITDVQRAPSLHVPTHSHPQEQIVGQVRNDSQNATTEHAPLHQQTTAGPTDAQQHQPTHINHRSSMIGHDRVGNQHSRKRQFQNSSMGNNEKSPGAMNMELINSNTSEKVDVDLTLSPHSANPTKFTNDNQENFLSIPPIKHNPPELLKNIQEDEARQLV